MFRYPADMIEGYQYCTCGCGRLELRYVTHQTGGLAFDCFRERHSSPLRERTIKIGLASMPVPNPKRRKRANKGNPDTRRKVAHAETRALRRLKHVYPEMFALLYEEERARLGLKPIVRVEPVLAQAVQTWDGLLAYHAPSNSGVADVAVQEGQVQGQR